MIALFVARQRKKARHGYTTAARVPVFQPTGGKACGNLRGSVDKYNDRKEIVTKCPAIQQMPHLSDINLKINGLLTVTTYQQNVSEDTMANLD